MSTLLKDKERTTRVTPRRVPATQGVLSTALQRLRHSQSLTLKQLSEKCGISVATLSKIERGQLSPTYEKIAALAQGLSVDVGRLFTSDDSRVPLGRRSVSRKGEGVVHQTSQYAYEVLHADLAAKKFVPLITTVKAHELVDFPELLRHDGEEFVYVLSGRVVIHTDLYAPIELAPGDSCYFDSTMGHACVSGGQEDAQILWVSTNVTGPESVSEA